jgi:hypothetical protein
MHARTILAIGLVALGLPAVADAQFEGVVVMTIHGEDGKRSQDLTQMIKGPLVRMDMSAAGAGGATMVIDSRTGMMTSIMHAQKMYMRMSLKAMAERAQGMTGGAGSGGSAPKITKTGQSETIAGRTCEHYLVDSEESDQDVDVCLARDMGTFGLAGAGGGPFGMARQGSMPQLPPGWEQIAAEFKDGAFPLKVERVSGSTRTTILVVKSIDAKPMDASQFEVPAGYREFQMPRR